MIHQVQKKKILKRVGGATVTTTREQPRNVGVSAQLLGAKRQRKELIKEAPLPISRSKRVQDSQREQKVERDVKRQTWGEGMAKAKDMAQRNCSFNRAGAV